MKDKKEFFEINKKIKNKEINITTLDARTASRILQMLNEEIKINDNRIEQKKEEYKNIKNINKRYNSGAKKTRWDEK